MKKFAYIFTLFLAVVLFAACSGSEDKTTSKDVKVDKQHEQEAINAGRVAARAVLSVEDLKDTFALQNKLLEARAVQSKYVSEGRKAEAEIFDTAFIHTLRAARPELARAIEQWNK